MATTTKNTRAAEFQAAIATKRPAATPDFKLVKVGPLECRFANVADDQRAHPIPTVESLAQVARQLLGAHADCVSTDAKDVRRRALLDAKATRAAAEGAVRTERLHNKAGQLHGKAAYAPLVTLVRKQLLTLLRESFKAQDSADAEVARQVAKREREERRVRDREQAKASRAARCAVLPDGCKPSKALSTDQTRPVLTCAHLTKTPDGNGWQMVCTDSYQACIFPLTTYGDAGLRECLLDTDTVKAIEKVGAFRFSAGMIEPLRFHRSLAKDVPNGRGGLLTVYPPSASSAGATRYAPAAPAHFPAVRDDGRKGKNALSLKPEPAASKRMEITFNSALLQQLAQAIGSVSGKAGIVTIAFSVDDFVKRESDGVREWNVKGHEVSGNYVSPSIRLQRKLSDGTIVRGHMMPVRP